jgi:hypothetical protein
LHLQDRKAHLALLIFAFGFYGCNPYSDEASGVCETNSNLYDYSLKDINSSSSTYGKNIGPGYFEDQVTLHYFGHQN